MKDIIFSSDIIQEIEDYYDGDLRCLFNQDNNDGQLFVDVTDNGIKYCFMRFYNEGMPMDGEHYMKWNCENDNRPDWHMSYEYMKRDTIAYTEENIKKINEMATLMTSDEIKSFVEEDYFYLFAPGF